MTVAVSCNLSDGVILGVDSAVTVPTEIGIAKVYENAEKLFQLGKLPIGIATYGLGVMGSRSLGSYIREYEVKDPDKIVEGEKQGSYTLEEVSESLRKFFKDVYDKEVTPLIEQQSGISIGDIPLEHLPAFGLVVAGFSAKQYLSEVWVLEVPHGEKAVCQRPQGHFGTNWFATYGAIKRYVHGFEPVMINEVMAYTESILGRAYTEEEIDTVREIVGGYEYRIPFEAMPMREGIGHTRFLVELAINHHRFSEGAPVVGGKAKLGMVTYRGEHFQLLDGQRDQERRGWI